MRSLPALVLIICGCASKPRYETAFPAIPYPQVHRDSEIGGVTFREPVDSVAADCLRSGRKWRRTRHMGSCSGPLRKVPEYWISSFDVCLFNDSVSCIQIQVKPTGESLKETLQLLIGWISRNKSLLKVGENTRRPASCKTEAALWICLEKGEAFFHVVSEQPDGYQLEIAYGRKYEGDPLAMQVTYLRQPPFNDAEGIEEMRKIIIEYLQVK